MVFKSEIQLNVLNSLYYFEVDGKEWIDPQYPYTKYKNRRYNILMDTTMEEACD